jgi:hypothetical protein
MLGIGQLECVSYGVVCGVFYCLVSAIVKSANCASDCIDLSSRCTLSWSKTTLNYKMMVERYPNLKEEVGGSIPGCEISSLSDGKLARWSTASCALALACQPSITKKEKNMHLEHFPKWFFS